MPALNSSWLAWAEYDSGRLHVLLHDGRDYTLRGVPIRHYHGLINATSPGGYFNRYLRGRY